MAHKRKRYKQEGIEAFRVADASRAFSIGGTTIRTAIKRGDLEASKMGKGLRSPVLITRTAIEEWLERCRIKPAAQ